MSESQEILRTPEEWSEIFNVIILDPDGWRGSQYKDWNEPLTREEFSERLWVSTISGGDPDRPMLFN